MSHKVQFSITIPETAPAVPQRVDVYLAEHAELCSRSQLRSRVHDLHVNGRPRKLSFPVGPGDQISGLLDGPAPSEAIPQPIEITVIHETSTYLVLNKPQGMVVHPGAGNPDQTLVNGLLYRYQEDDQLPGPDALRPGIVHRLDKDTSGVMIVARNLATHDHLVTQFSHGAVQKTYIAVVKGVPRENQGEITTSIQRDPDNRRRYATGLGGGKPAETHWRALRRFKNHSLLMLSPRTGRTHQLRVHLTAQGWPILGDPVYARPDKNYREATLMLHALRLTVQPDPQAEARTFFAPPPPHFMAMLKSLISAGG